MSKNIKNYDKNNNSNITNKFTIETPSQPIETPYYIKQNIRKTIDYLFSNNIK